MGEGGCAPAFACRSECLGRSLRAAALHAGAPSVDREAVSPALLIHGFTVLLAVAIALRVGARRDKSDLHWLLLAVLASAVLWSTGEGVRAVVDAPVWRRAALRVSFLGVMALPAFWLLLAGRYARVTWLVGRPGIYAVLLAPSVAGYLALLTNDAHHGIIREVFGPAPGPRSWAGPFFWIFLVWAYVCSIWGSCLYIGPIRRLRAEGERLRAVGLAFAASGPPALGLLAISGLQPRGTSLTPIGVVLSMLVLSAILRYRLLQHVPLDHRDVIEHLREGAIMASASGLVLDVNPAAERLLDRSRDEIMGLTLGDAVGLLVQEGERDALRRRLGCLDETPLAVRSELETADGGRIAMLASCVRDADDEVVGRFAMLRDQSDAHRYRGIVRRTQKLETVGTLAAGIAHELNNPLAYVRANLGQIQRLGERVDEARDEGVKLAEDLSELREIASESLAGIERIERIVADMRRLSVAPSEGFAPVEVNETVEEAVRMAKRRRGTPVDVVLRLADDLPPVDGSAQLLVQALLNLLVNACQALDGAVAPHIEVETARAGDTVAIEVRDNGPGIPEAVQGRVFDPFYTTKPPGVGTGLGLPIVVDILSDHGGSIDLVSSPGRGARFTVRLPVGRDA
jgi:PAS domain S-box-containing protein